MFTECSTLEVTWQAIDGWYIDKEFPGKGLIMENESISEAKNRPVCSCINVPKFNIRPRVYKSLDTVCLVISILCDIYISLAFISDFSPFNFILFWDWLFISFGLLLYLNGFPDWEWSTEALECWTYFIAQVWRRNLLNWHYSQTLSFCKISSFSPNRRCYYSVLLLFSLPSKSHKIETDPFLVFYENVAIHQG